MRFSAPLFFPPPRWRPLRNSLDEKHQGSKSTKERKEQPGATLHVSCTFVTRPPIPARRKLTNRFGVWRRLLNSVVKTVFLENGLFDPYRKQVVLTKNDDLHSTHKTRGCAPQSPETDENDENGGCPSDKTRVCQKHRFRHPD